MTNRERFVQLVYGQMSVGDAEAAEWGLERLKRAEELLREVVGDWSGHVGHCEGDFDPVMFAEISEFLGETARICGTCGKTNDLANLSICSRCASRTMSAETAEGAYSNRVEDGPVLSAEAIGRIVAASLSDERRKALLENTWEVELPDLPKEGKAKPAGFVQRSESDPPIDWDAYYRAKGKP